MNTIRSVNSSAHQEVIAPAGLGFVPQRGDRGAAPSTRWLVLPQRVHADHRRVKLFLVAMASMALLGSFAIELFAQSMQGKTHVATLLLAHYLASWSLVLGFGGLLLASAMWLHERWHLRRIPAVSPHAYHRKGA